jgi:5'-nucleotidase (lipoprotein e(P4) family)
MLRTVVLTFSICLLAVLGSAQSTAPQYETLEAILWTQTSVEYKANSIQTYRAAKHALRRGLKDPHWTAALEQDPGFESLPPAVIVDLDETVLDNSPFEVRMLLAGKPFSADEWARWLEEKNAGLVPGSMDFLQFAHASGVATLYITNRVCDPSKSDDATVQVLRKLQVPLDSASSWLLCDDGKKGDKADRRRKFASRFRILLLIGDQLGDFLQIPPNLADLAGREKLFDAHQRFWGERWFQLSNPMYGSWNDAAGSTIGDKLKHLRK